LAGVREAEEIKTLEWKKKAAPDVKFREVWAGSMIATGVLFFVGGIVLTALGMVPDNPGGSLPGSLVALTFLCLVVCPGIPIVVAIQRVNRAAAIRRQLDSLIANQRKGRHVVAERRRHASLREVGLTIDTIIPLVTRSKNAIPE
jgi:hypothetical protein